MKKIRINHFLLPAALGMLLLGSCKKSFIEVDPKGQFLTTNYYQDGTQAYGALVGVYDAMRKNSGGFENMITMMNAGSDDQLAGGASETDGQGIQDFCTFKLTAYTIPGSFWSDHYQGIFRANTLLLKIPNTVMDASLKERIVAETKALRANYYFNLVRMFKNIPLILEPLDAITMYNVKQTSPDSIYFQIEKDLTEAIPALPQTVRSADEAGRLNKGAAQALLGKVYLYENKNTEAAAQFAEVNGTPGGISQYGYQLLANYNELWIVSNRFNPESIIEVTHSNQRKLGDWGLWGSGEDEGNGVNQMVGPRSYIQLKPYAPNLAAGWSFNVFTQNFIDFMQNDPRLSATVINMAPLVLDTAATYIPAHQNTGYFLNKYLPRRSDIAPSGSSELNYQQDSYVIRLADTYLMEAEALGSTGPRAQALLDAVRTRVGLPSVPVSLSAIKDERRREFAGEGLRFFDLVRWGDAASVLASRGFVAGKNEVFPIPVSELTATQLVQNPMY